jgi:hypothetical protein
MDLVWNSTQFHEFLFLFRCKREWHSISLDDRLIHIPIYLSKLNSMDLVRKQTIPIEWRHLSAKLVARVAWSAQRIPAAVNLDFLDLEPLFFHSSSSSVVSRGWVDPVPDLLLLRKSGSAGNRTRDLWICIQEIWHYNTEAVIYLSIYGSTVLRWGGGGERHTNLSCEGNLRSAIQWSVHVAYNITYDVRNALSTWIVSSWI